MATGTDRPLATVHRLRPRLLRAHGSRRQRPGLARVGVVIDLSTARRARRVLPIDQPPEGTAA